MLTGSRPDGRRWWLPTGLRRDNRGAAVLIGFILFVGIVILAMGLLQVTYVPGETRSAEVDHDRSIQAEMTQLGTSIDRAARTGSDRGTALRLAPEYPSWPFLLSPPSSAGTVETTESGQITLENVAVEGAENARLYRDAVDTLETRRVVYRPQYREYDAGATLRYEHGVVSASFPEGTDQLRSAPDRLFNGNSIRLTAVQGNFSRSRQTMSLEARATGSGAQSVPVTSDGDGSLRITLPTDADTEVWEAALPDEATVLPEAEGRVTIELPDRPEPYDLYLGGVALEERQPEPAAYLVNVTAQQVAPGERFTVEARDRYDNPVADAPLQVSGCDLSDSSTDDDGRATFVCDQATEQVTVALDGPEQDPETPNPAYEQVVFDTSSAVPGTLPSVTPERVEATERVFDTRSGERERTRLRIDYSAVADEDAPPDLEPTNLESAFIEVYERDTAFPDPDDGELVTATTQPLSGPTDDGVWTTPWLPPGDYAVNIRVANEDGQTAIGYSNVTDVFPSLLADPGPDRIVGVGEEVAFDGSGSQGNIESYRWEFGDGTTAEGVEPPPHTYAEPGTYEVRLTVTAADGETASRTASVEVVTSEGTISGVVNSEAGDPLEGVTLRFLDENGEEVASTRTDAEGRYTVELPSDRTYTVVADGSDLGFSTELATVPLPADEGATQDFTLAALDGAIQGTVTSQAGTPLEGVTVEVRDPQRDVVVATATTDADGSYDVGVAGDRTYTVVADGREIGFSTETATDVRVPPGATAIQNFELASLGGSLGGTVTSEAGEPLAGVTVDVIDPDTGAVVATATTDEAGEYAVAVAGDRSYDVRADGQAIGFDVETRPGVPVGPGQAVRGVDFALTPLEGSISGTVTSEAGDALAGVTVEVRDSTTGAIVASTTTDGDGTYEIPVDGDRTYTVVADGEDGGFSTESRSVTVGPGEAVTDVDFTLAPLEGSISGTVTSEAGAALEGVTIEAIDPETGTVVAEARTGADGTYAMAVAGDRSYDVRADGQAVGFDVETRSVTVGPGEDVTDVDFTLAPLEGSISGTVRDQGNNPLAGVTVQIRDPTTGTTVASATTDSQGRYTIPVEGDRTYNVRTDGSALGFSTETRTGVTVGPGEDVTGVDFTLAPLGGSIGGTVRNEAGNALGGVQVQVLDPATGTVVGTATTDSQGRYAIQVAGDRSYDVRADGRPLGLTLETRTGVSVGPGQAITGVDFTLRVPTGSIAGQVVNEGGIPIQGVRIRITNPDTGALVATALTDSQGRYSLPVTGDRSYVVEADGTNVFYSTASRSVTVGPDQSLTGVDFTLSPIGRAADVVFVEGSQLSFGQANAQYGFALRNDGSMRATIQRIAIPRVDGRAPLSVIGREQTGGNAVFRPTFTVAAADGTTSTPAAGSLPGTERIIVGGDSRVLPTPAAIEPGQTVRFTTGEFKTTTTEFQRQNMVGATVVLSVTFGDGSQRTIVISP